jgi:hypothetical protein
VDVVADLPADAQASEPVEQADGPFDNVAVGAQARAVWGAAAGDAGFDVLLPDEPPVLVVVVAAVGEQALGSAARSANAAADRWDRLQQR